MYKWIYQAPDGFSNIIMTSDEEYLTGLFFEDSQDVFKHKTKAGLKQLRVFDETCKWLDIYFAGSQPDFTPQYRMENLTPFRQAVIDIMCQIPFGKTMTYGEIARKIEKNRKISRMSAQAVGGAVGWNPICLIIPCHRVVGANGALTGYGGGLENKIALLALEQNKERFNA